MNFQLVLGSSSQSRHDVLRKLGLPFISIAPDINESVLPNEKPIEHVTRLSIEKAKRVADILTENPKHYDLSTDYWVIGSDQVAYLEGQPVSKPETHENAVQQLLASRGKSITFYTGLCLWHLKDGSYQTSVDTTTTHYRLFTLDQIESYLNKEKPYHCAGSLKSEGLGIALIEKVDSKDPNTLIGLPLIDLCNLMHDAGLKIF